MGLIKIKKLKIKMENNRDNREEGSETDFLVAAS